MNAVPSSRLPSSSQGPGSQSALVSDVAKLQMLSRIAEQVGVGVVVSDNDGWFQYVNSEFAAQHATTVEDLVGVHLSDFYRKEDLVTKVEPLIAEALRNGIGRMEVIRIRRDGTEFPAHVTLTLVRDDAGTLIGRVACMKDISGQRRLEEELRQAALYDPLTGLANRRLLRDRVEHALALTAGRRTAVAALFVDLDGFKKVNDTFGHDVGDEVLMEVARRLGKRTRECDTLARHGGDEYVMLLEELTDHEQVVTIAQRLLDAFSEPVRTTAGDIVIWASIGIHVSTEDDDYDSLLRSADTAMYDAKRTGDGGIRFFAPRG